MIAERLRQIESRIAAAAIKSGRQAADVTLVAVSKHQSSQVMQAYAEIMRARAQVAIFGESYLQEYNSKRAALLLPHKVHLIGPLQSNKVARAVEIFDLIESVHSLRIAELISLQANKRSKKQAVYLQVNISNDDNKHGFSPKEIYESLGQSIMKLDGLDVQGLMAITRLYDVPEDARADFGALRSLRDKLQGAFALSAPLALSMGMSADYEVAIEEGATHVRIGSALFGERS